jgi:hypothetical protein
MSVLVAPEWLTATWPTGAFGTPAVFDPLANVLTLRFSDQVLLAGSNGAVFARLYENSIPSSSGATQVGAQTATFFAGDGAVLQFGFDASLVSLAYVMGVFGSNTTGNTNGLYMALLDDVGLGGSLTPSGCCHDPMLDLILAAVKRVYSNS